LTKEQIEALKEELKAELLQELQINPCPRSEKPWNKIRKDLEKRLDFKNPHQYRIILAVATIIRYALNISSVLMLSDKQVPRAREIANQVIDILNPAGTDN